MSDNSVQGSGTEGTKADPPATKKRALPVKRDSLQILDRMAVRKAAGKFPVLSIFAGFAIAAPIMLVGLPLGALYIVHTSECCTNESVEQLISFWGSVLTGMLALFGVMVTAVFVITSFRIDKSARDEAAVEAADAAGNFFVKYKKALIERIDEWLCEVKSKKAEAKAEIAAAKDAAIEDIDAAKSAAEAAGETAIAEIAEVRDNVVRNGDQAATAIGQAINDVNGRKAAAIERIDAEVADVERAAVEAKARIAAQPDDSPPTDSRD